MEEMNNRRNIQKNIAELRRIIHFLKFHNIIYDNRNVVIMMMDALNDVTTAGHEFIKRHKDIIFREDDKFHCELPRLF